MNNKAKLFAGMILALSAASCTDEVIINLNNDICRGKTEIEYISSSSDAIYICNAESLEKIDISKTAAKTCIYDNILAEKSGEIWILSECQNGCDKNTSQCIADTDPITNPCEGKPEGTPCGENKICNDNGICEEKKSDEDICKDKDAGTPCGENKICNDNGICEEKKSDEDICKDKDAGTPCGENKICNDNGICVEKKSDEDICKDKDAGTPCGQGKICDENHQCVEKCTNDTSKCVGNSIYTCKENLWSLSDTCSGNERCTESRLPKKASCTTVGIQCTDGVMQCRNNKVMQCNNNKWTEQNECKGPKPFCNMVGESAECGECKNNSSRCENENIVITCKNGSWSHEGIIDCKKAQGICALSTEDHAECESALCRPDSPSKLCANDRQYYECTLDNRYHAHPCDPAQECIPGRGCVGHCDVNSHATDENGKLTICHDGYQEIISDTILCRRETFKNKNTLYHHASDKIFFCNNERKTGLNNEDGPYQWTPLKCLPGLTPDEHEPICVNKNFKLTNNSDKLFRNGEEFCLGNIIIQYIDNQHTSFTFKVIPDGTQYTSNPHEAIKPFKTCAHYKKENCSKSSTYACLSDGRPEFCQGEGPWIEISQKDNCFSVTYKNNNDKQKYNHSVSAGILPYFKITECEIIFHYQENTAEVPLEYKDCENSECKVTIAQWCNTAPKSRRNASDSH